MNEHEFSQLINFSVKSHRRFRDQWESFDTDPSTAVSAERSTSILSELEERLRDNYPFFHPRYAGQMLKPPHPIAVAAYLMAMQINPNNHALDGGPATAEMELDVVRQIAGMFGYSEYMGHLTSSGTTANLEALWVSRCIHPQKAIAFSRQAHYTHQRMCDVIKSPSVVIDSMDTENLESLFKTGTIGTLVVTLGTTGTGSVEPLHEILPLARKYGVRIHADCAYGGFFTLLAQRSTPTVSPEPFLALKDCDSIVIDPHKHGLQPYGCGCVLFKDPAVGTFYKHDSPYTYFTSTELHLGEISLECSRAGASAAALWATLKALPLRPDEGLGPILSKSRNAALIWSELISTGTTLNEYCRPDLDIVIYFPRTKHFSATEVSTVTERIVQTAMTKNDSPLYLASYIVPSASIKHAHPAFLVDAPITKVLRSVLMKPEHEHFVTTLYEEVSSMIG
ncbi:MAG: aspartate aminotransferase family protein [Bacteroidetes bacterium]|nr:aspartate aminotransferase family protein [Bacteroidota bacterium]